MRPLFPPRSPSPRRLSIGTAWFFSSLLGAALLSAVPGCKRNAGESAIVSDALPDDDADPAAPPAPPARLVSHRELVGMIDFSKFTPPEKAHRRSASAVNADFSIEKKDPAIVRKIAASLEQSLAQQGWKPAPKAGAEMRTDDGAMAYFEKQGAALLMAIGTSRGYAEGTQDVNAGLFLLGQLDLRTLPKFPGSAMTTASFDTLQFSTTAKIGEVRKFYSDALVKLGWTEYRRPEIPGHERTAAQLETEQAFVKNGTSINFHYRTDAGKLIVLSRVSVLERELHMPPEAKVVQMDVSTPYLFYSTGMKPDEVFAFYQQALTPDGWRGQSAPAPDGRISKFFRFDAAGRKSLTLACLPDRGATFVELREAK